MTSDDPTTRENVNRGTVALVVVAALVLIGGLGFLLGRATAPNAPEAAAPITPAVTETSPSAVQEPESPRVGIIGTIQTIWFTEGTDPRCKSLNGQIPLTVRDASGTVLTKTRSSAVDPLTCSETFVLDLPKVSVYQIQLGKPGEIGNTPWLFTLRDLRERDFHIKLIVGE